MLSRDALTALAGAAAIVAIIVAMAVFLPLSSLEGFGGAPHNLQLYDRPYKNYPSYEGRSAVKWSADNRCSAFCQQSPCTVWCR